MLPDWEREAWALNLLTLTQCEDQADCFHFIFHQFRPKLISISVDKSLFSACSDKITPVPS